MASLWSFLSRDQKSKEANVETYSEEVDNVDNVEKKLNEISKRLTKGVFELEIEIKRTRKFTIEIDFDKNK